MKKFNNLLYVVVVDANSTYRANVEIFKNTTIFT